MRLRRARKKERGLTLLEVAIASAVMAIVCLGGIKLLGDCTRLGDGTKGTYMALNDARSLMEEIKHTPYSSIQTTNWSSVATTMGLNTLTSEQINVVVQQVSTTLLSIQVSVRWNDGTRQRQIQLVTQRASGQV